MEKYIDLILSTLKEIGEDDDNALLLEAHAKTKLFGSAGILDSIGVVFLISELEDKVQDEFDKDIVLADEKAMSQVTSPFRSVETLATYLCQLVEG